MSFGVFCTFDLKNATSAQYKQVYEDLAKIGLARVVAGTKGNVVIPTTSVTGQFDGVSAHAVRDHVREKVKQAVSARGLRSEIFVFVGANTTWGATTT
jgi:hypothetical protein